MTIRILLVALAASASLTVAACGGGETPSSGPTSGRKGIDAKTKQAMLNFAKCMREHGVDMPDPKFNEGGGVQMTQKEANPETARAAEQACKHFQDEVKPPPMSEKDQAEMRKRALANAKCMRDHGVTNFPDPQFGADGRMTMALGKEHGLDPQSPKFQEAQKACAKETGMGGMIARGPKP